jgi:hypothetical protein
VDGCIIPVLSGLQAYSVVSAANEKAKDRSTVYFPTGDIAGTNSFSHFSEFLGSDQVNRFLLSWLLE